MADLENTARALVAEGKGILAADESTGTIKKRFDSIGVESTEDNRRAYRDLLFTTEGVEEYISGVILFDETIRQSGHDGTPFPKLLESKGVIPGIKVDQGAKPLALAEGETVTEGLDGLRARLEEYRKLGARFAKWRATYSISDSLPSDYCIWANAHALARFPLRNTRAHGIHDPDHFMAGHARVLQARPMAFLDQRITVTDATGLDFDPHQAGIRPGNFSFNDFKRSLREGDLRGTHLWHKGTLTAFDSVSDDPLFSRRHRRAFPP